MATNYKIQDGKEIRPMTKEEVAALELAQDEVKAREEQETKRQSLRAATLTKLGLTADEVSALLG